MSVDEHIFFTPHSKAFHRLGAIEPGQHWSAFDVPREEVQEGKAKLFVTTIWNRHSSKDEEGHRIPKELATIAKDQIDGTLWYRVSKPQQDIHRNNHHTAHWNGFQEAIKRGIPIIGVLKDVVTERCSLKHLFDCSNPRYQVDEKAMWIELRPRGEVGCAVGQIDIRKVISGKLTPNTFSGWNQHFEESVQDALQRNTEARKARIASASPLPKRVEVTATVFDRNPDVVAEVLLRAKGVCEHCANPAPFLRRSDGTPYLEVHHKTPLSVGGEDTVDNAYALCPNCHRKAHYG